MDITRQHPLERRLCRVGCPARGDQRRAVVALETAREHEALATANTPPTPAAETGQDGPDDAPDARAIPVTPQSQVAASLERGRIASLALSARMATMFGTQRRYEMSNNPWCVGPSCGERPARSMQKITGKS